MAHGVLELGSRLQPGRYLIGVHIRDFTHANAEWNLPGSYYVDAVAATFKATPLDCTNSQVVVIGPPELPAVRQLVAAFDCARLESRETIEIHAEPTEDPCGRRDSNAPFHA